MKSELSLQENLAAEQENELSEYLKTLSQMDFGLNLKALRKLAYELAIKKNLEVLEQLKVNQCAGIEWYQNFLRRNNDLALRTATNRSLSHAVGFNENTVTVF